MEEVKKEVNKEELGDCLMQLRFINDNLHFIRLGLISGECDEPEVIDNAVYLIEQNIDKVIERIDAAF